MKALRGMLDRLGAAGVAGLGILAFCVPFYFSALAPALGELERRSAPAKARPATQAGLDGEDLERFYSRFPAVERLPGELDTLYAHAKVANVQLLQGEYRLESGAGPLAAYRVTLPVRGSYPQVRQFVGRVLKEMPTTSLDAVRFERKRAADSQLEAQVRLTIYLRRGT
jgi:hypothetical protein